jgi:hypothetical protein
MDYVNHPECHTKTDSASVHRLIGGEAKDLNYITGQFINKLRDKKY